MIYLAQRMDTQEVIEFEDDPEFVPGFGEPMLAPNVSVLRKFRAVTGLLPLRASAGWIETTDADERAYWLFLWRMWVDGGWPPQWPPRFQGFRVGVRE